MVNGRIIGYLPGWNDPPHAEELKDVGYTHIIVSFAVFDLLNPGKLVSAFDSIRSEYINSLKKLGLKVLLSVGGASTNIPDTTINFHQVVKKALNFDVFKNNFINSYQELVLSYGFDGLDFDIEHDFNNILEPLNKNSSFENPQGDVQIVIEIIHQLKRNNPKMLISLVPQAANISPTGAFNQTWGNYICIISKTYYLLDWVGIQLYNTGGMFDINQQIHAASIPSSRIATSPDFSVAMATNLLESWPKTINNRPTGWLPYISKLDATQVAIGYPVPNKNSISDGSPYAPISIIKRAIKCLRTKTISPASGDTYVAPRAYPMFGSVFCWDITHDKDNDYQFARGLKDIINSNIDSSVNLTIKINNHNYHNVIIEPNRNLSY